MRYDFVYENSNGEKINLSKLPYKINIEPLIDYSWSYKTKQRQLGNKIVGFFKDIKDSTATLHVLAATVKERDEAIDYFNNVIEKDIYYGTAGKLWLGDWYTYAFITASKNSKWQYDAGIVKKEITISKEADSWYHITRSANYGEQEESTKYIAEDYIKTYEGRDAESSIKSLTATIIPQQSGSGTPSPENIRPISGWESVETVVSGVNVWDEEWELGSISTTTGENIPSTTSIRSTNYIPVKSGSYYIRISGSTTLWAAVLTYDANKNFIANLGGKTGGSTITLNADVAYIRFYLTSNYGTTYNNDISINYPSTDHDYHAYITPTTHTTDLGRTVYGGTVDVVSGTLTVTHALVDLGTLTFAKYGSDTVYYASVPNKADGNTNVLADKFFLDAVAISNMADGSMRGYASNANVYFRRNDCATLADWNTWLSNNPTQLCYELSTPTTYTLTPQQINTLAGVNNVWAESGNVTVIFRDDHGDIQTESGSIVTFEKTNALSGSGYDYAYDYMHDAQSQKIIANAGSIPCDFIITIQGYADSPIITIGDNTYAVNVEVPYGANLVIDSTQKTVIITLADGTKINAFGARDPDYYLFERIKSGKNAVTWDGSYLWELLMIEERSEPRWLTD